MSSEVVTVYDDACVGEVVDLLQARRISGVPVLHRGSAAGGEGEGQGKGQGDGPDGGEGNGERDEAGDRVVGVISGTDIRRLAAQHPKPGEANGRGFYLDDRSGIHLRGFELDAVPGIPVREVMSTSLVTVSADDPTRACAHKMVERRVHRVLVTSGTKLEGIVSSTDLLRLIAERRLSVANGRVEEPGSAGGAS